jgi:hypothetical protein
MMEQEFGQKISNIMSIPGWGQGILFGMLKAMGMTEEFSAENVPTGNPNILRISKMRETEGQSLKSDLQFKLETAYEQKYINGIDPGSAFLDIMSNLFKMGTSDQKFILTTTDYITHFLGNVNNAGNAQAWVDLTIDLVKNFIKAIGTFFNEMSTIGQGFVSTNLTQTQEEKEKAEKDAKEVNANSATIASLDAFSNSLNGAKGIVSTILVGTISKYRWPLKGSISLMTGLSTTPWHLTIGNPYSPIVNIANVLIRDVNVKLSNDLGFNDLPVRIDVSISAGLGRPLGKQELEKIFNNGYKRIYSQNAMDQWTATNPATSNVSASGEATQIAQVSTSGTITPNPNGGFTESRINSSVNVTVGPPT